MEYRVVNSEKVNIQLAQLREEFDRMRDIEHAIVWALQHRPRLPFAIDLKGKNCFLWITNNLPTGFPRCRIVYQVNDRLKEVLLISIERMQTVPLSWQ